MKICLLGDTGVGKTCLCRNLTGEDFDKYLEPTIGASFYSIYLKNHLDDKAHFWDTAGQERYRSLTNMYVRGCDVIILVLSKKGDWMNSLDYWIKFYDKYKEIQTRLIIVFSKIDKKNQLPTNDDLSIVKSYIKSFNLQCNIIQHSSFSNIASDEIRNELIELSKYNAKFKPKKNSLNLKKRDEYYCCTIL